MSELLKSLHSVGGQSPWLDNLQRSYLNDGTLRALIADGVRGLTSNPTIFQKAIQGSADYDDQFASLMRTGRSVVDAYWEMVITDINGALDEFADLHGSSGGVDGFVSVEVNPSLAHDGERTLSEARALHQRINRPNVMIKIPATRAGLGAIRSMIAEGRSVNVTLIFSVERHIEVMEAYIAGLEDALAAGRRVDGVQSVASFFISRVDNAIDPLLEAVGSPEALALRGRSAVNQARLAYEAFEAAFSGPRWSRLADAGASVQRPLWASTSTKNPAYPDTLYVDELIGPMTVNTLPEATLHAFADHGTVSRTITRDTDVARSEWDALASLGIDVDNVALRLEEDGVASFIQSFDDLIAALAAKAPTAG